MEAALAVLVIIAGLALGPIARFLERREGQRLEKEWRQQRAKSRKGLSPDGRETIDGVSERPPRAEPQGRRVLICFAIIIIILGLITLVRFWPKIQIKEGDFWFWVWLFLTMVSGMFVQVLAANYRSGKDLFTIEASRLLFPLLFSIVVFYPIWGIGASAPKDFFSFYAAFLNGYFWETVVSAAKPPTSRDT